MKTKNFTSKNINEVEQINACIKEHRKEKRAKCAAVVLITLSFMFAAFLFVLAFVEGTAINVGDESVEIRVKSDYEPHYEATALFGIINLNRYVKVEGEIDTEKVGVYELKYSIFNKTVTKTVSVVDNEAPKIDFIVSNELKIDSIEKYLDNEPSINEVVYANDNYSENVEIKQTVMPFLHSLGSHTYFVIYEAFDESGNTDGVIRKLDKIDRGGIKFTFNVKIDAEDTHMVERILDILKEQEAPATFFVTGDLKGDKAVKLLTRMRDEGHTIGLLGYSDDYQEIYSNESSVVGNYLIQDMQYSELFNERAQLYRFPDGNSNIPEEAILNNSDLISKVKELMKNEFRCIDWNINAAQFETEFEESMLHKLYNNPNTITVFEIDSENEFIVDSLEYIVKRALYDGYHFEAITSETPLMGFAHTFTFSK